MQNHGNSTWARGIRDLKPWLSIQNCAVDTIKILSTSLQRWYWYYLDIIQVGVSAGSRGRRVARGQHPHVHHWRQGWLGGNTHMYTIGDKGGSGATPTCTPLVTRVARGQHPHVHHWWQGWLGGNTHMYTIGDKGGSGATPTGHMYTAGDKPFFVLLPAVNHLSFCQNGVWVKVLQIISLAIYN